ncbi:hypothetical protein Bhyg_12032 [Pseudolycoriella hygida]|uniref:Uncharacterized protein n=1 Tax=Pseudolycoriella hygida TaxID=35572 RepID=A0A9Q0MXY2_9DIPT|nr:hypothetical protein Bhyg_12032 [Pseudolycoriella hygida]
MKQDSPRKGREMGPCCSSPFCKRSKARHCDKFDEASKLKIFKCFWKLSPWSAKQIFVQTLVKSVSVNGSSRIKSRRQQTFKYFLYLCGHAVQVCKSFLLSTLGLRSAMVKNWIEKTPEAIDQLKRSKQAETQTLKRNPLQVARKDHLFVFFDNLEKMESHYCRKDSKKQYLAATFRSKAELYEVYKKYTVDNGYGQGVSYFTFSQFFDQNNLALFTPRKDQCDTCVGFIAGQVSVTKYNLHIERKRRAKDEKDFDKQAALEGRCHVFTMDKQSVKLSPNFNASAIYFKTRMQVHNFTVYNLANHHCNNYWWDETQGDLSASSFASYVIQHIQTHCLSDTLPIILYSDGCGGQNRNYFLSNALSNFTVKNNKIIEQKWLEKGHTQMECDSAHAKIEKKLKNRSIFVPKDYIDVTKTARKTIAIDNIRQEHPFEAAYLQHDFFSNYARKDQLRFRSIRPGVKAKDPTVSNLRSLIYLPDGKIKYTIDFDEEYKDLPRKIIPYDYKKHEPKRLHQIALGNLVQNTFKN